jgi:Fe-S oxidoreductase
MESVSSGEHAYQLGRGLGVYDAPRAMLTRMLGRAPDEFVEAREAAVCSGAGRLLPSTMADIDRSIARARLRATPARAVATSSEDARQVSLLFARQRLVPAPLSKISRR